uniref:Putative ovule protein n=1 Tax=Solanum chacoense TaxID=4108 RepID=A0A0V0IUH1_SOLCH
MTVPKSFSFNGVRLPPLFLLHCCLKCSMFLLLPHFIHVHVSILRRVLVKEKCLILLLKYEFLSMPPLSLSYFGFFHEVYIGVAQVYSSFYFSIEY